LIAQGKAKPMLVVMPFGHALKQNDPRTRDRNAELFEQDLLTNIVPAVDSEYPTMTGPKNRALAGLSMGGSQTLSIGLKHLDQFGSLGVFSSGARADFEERNAGVLADAKSTNKRLSLFWIAIGREDTGFANAEHLDKLLTDHNINHTFQPTDGAHTWRNWRRYLGEFAPLLFRS
jgi:enterochelin esterase family protein